ALGAQFQRRDCGRVVDVDVGVGERAGRLRELGPVALDQLPGADALRVDPRLGREHAHDQLLFGHFQREDADAAALLLVLRATPDVRRYIQYTGRLSHRGSVGED